MKKAKSKSFFIFLYVAIALLVVGVLYAIFHKDIQEFGDWLERIGQREQNYKRDNPNASDSDMKKAFSEGISNIEKWGQDYKKNHPNATDSDIEKAWNDIRNK